MLAALLPLLATLAPVAARALGRLISGDKGEEVAARIEPAVTDLAVRIFGTDDTPTVLARLRANPAKAEEFAEHLSDAAIQAKAQIEVERIRAETASEQAEVADRGNAREHQQRLAALGNIAAHGANVVSTISVVGFFGIFGLMLWRPFALDAISAQVVNIMAGALVSAYASTIAYWLGSSRGSRDKDQAIADVLTKQPAPVPVPVPQPAPAPPSPSVVVVPTPAPVPVPAPEPAAEPEVAWQQGPYGGVRFRLDADGYVLVEGEQGPGRSVGEPATVRRIWRDYGGIIADCCARNGVPLEVVVACIATESRGIAKAVLTEPDGRQSIGLMQVLTSTAEEVMGKKLSAADLANPIVGIEAGVRYIRRQYPTTKFMPPFVAAAYNAGGLYPPRDGDTNRWRLRSTGDHIDRFTWFYDDARFVAMTDRWTQ